MMELLRDAKRFIEDLHTIRREMEVLQGVDLDKSLDELKKTTETLEATIKVILKRLEE